MARPPKVSVCMVTYNHAPYIAEALESVLAQEVDFPYEIVVCDDASTDGAQAIIRDYASKHPGVVRPTFGSVNTGGLFREAIRTAQGDYIAILDGDDYWTDRRKLKMQADFLDANPDYVHCFHNTLKIYPDGRSHPYNGADTRREWSLSDVLAHPGCIVAPASYFFRRGLFGSELPEWHTRIARASNNGDWALVAANAEHGKGRYFPEVMSVYRFHGKGVWSGLPQVVQQETQLLVVRGFLDRFGDQHGPILHAHITAFSSELAAHYAFQGNFSESARLLRNGYEKLPDWRARAALTTSTARKLALKLRAEFSASVPDSVRSVVKRTLGRAA